MQKVRVEKSDGKEKQQKGDGGKKRQQNEKGKWVIQMQLLLFPVSLIHLLLLTS